MFPYVCIQLNSFVGSGSIFILGRILPNPEMDIEMYYLQKERRRDNKQNRIPVKHNAQTPPG